MIPYFEWRTFALGPLTMNVWGLMVALGFLMSVVIARAYVRKRGGDPEIMTNLAVWTIVGAAIGARLFHAYLYFPAEYLRDPVELIRIWNGGWSSLGGFVGGPLAAWIFLRRGQMLNVKCQVFIHASLFAFPWGWAIGRVGCFLIHDHPGTLTSSVLGVRYPGGARFDLGFFEILNAIGMGAVILVVRRFTRRDDIAVIAGVGWYASVRFLTDFLRSSDLPTSDSRYYGLTPAQFGMILIIVFTFLYALPRLQTRISR